MKDQTTTLTARQKRALRLLSRGGARYGTMHAEMTQLRDLGLAVAHDNGGAGAGRWTWRPTQAGRGVIERSAHA